MIIGMCDYNFKLGFDFVKIYLGNKRKNFFFKEKFLRGVYDVN